jgi:hypothetical protein
MPPVQLWIARIASRNLSPTVLTKVAGLAL